MTDEELVMQVADKVMGWTDSFHANPEDKWWCSQDKDFCNMPDTRIIKISDFNPLTNPAHWMMVVERMRELGWSFKLWRNPGPELWGVHFWNDENKAQTKILENLGHAVCEAALKAVRG